MEGYREYIGQRFGDVIGSLHSDIKLGSCDGSAFWYIGPSDAVNDRKMYELDIWANRALRTALQNQKENLGVLLAHFPTLEGYAASHYKEDKTFGDLDGYWEEVRYHFTRLEARKKGIKKAKRRCEERKPLEDRTVIDIYPSIDIEEDTLIVIVEGCEKGFAWFESEYRAGGEIEKEDGYDDKFEAEGREE